MCYGNWTDRRDGRNSYLDVNVFRPKNSEKGALARMGNKNSIIKHNTGLIQLILLTTVTKFLEYMIINVPFFFL